MIKVSVFYPHKDGARFDIDYYCRKHMPMVRDKLGAACTGIAVERGLAGGAPGSKPSFAAMGHIYCESAEAFQAAFRPHAKDILGDIPNYTDIEPTIQISEVKL